MRLPENSVSRRRIAVSLRSMMATVWPAASTACAKPDPTRPQPTTTTCTTAHGIDGPRTAGKRPRSGRLPPQAIADDLRDDRDSASRRESVRGFREPSIVLVGQFEIGGCHIGFELSDA